MKNKRLIKITGFSLLLLLIPFVAMQFSEQVNWSVGDFMVAAALLIFAGIGIELTLRLVRKIQTRILIIVLFILMLALLWAELGVGLIESLFKSF